MQMEQMTHQDIADANRVDSRCRRNKPWKTKISGQFTKAQQTQMEQITDADGANHGRRRQADNSLRYSRCKWSGRGTKDIEADKAQTWKELQAVMAMVIVKPNILLKLLAFVLTI